MLPADLYYQQNKRFLAPDKHMTTDRQIQHREALHAKLKSLLSNIARFTSDRDAHYESSWKKRGGVGAMLTIARPWDRFEAIAQRKNWDIFKVLQEEIDQGKDENVDGTLHACIRDLLCYMALLLVEAKDMRKVYAQSFAGVQPDKTYKECDPFPSKEYKAGTVISESASSLPQRTPREQRDFVKAELQRLQRIRDDRIAGATAKNAHDDLDTLITLLISIL